MLRLAACRARPACFKPLPSPSWTKPFSSSPGRQGFSAAAVAEPMNRVQMYISRSLDPYLNLSIEHYLLEKSPPDSVVLFLYTNRPCVVIGRNQNPWLEVNLGLVRRAPQPEAGEDEVDFERLGEEDMSLGTSNGSSTSAVVDLVRRRSGGGTVFHDLGNSNYSVLCPPADFDRNRHAEMVVRALRKLGATTARVNERHDIVLDGAAAPTQHTDIDTAADASRSSSDGEITTTQARTQTRTFKISGSAYKLTRKRALHHGTCLLASPNLGAVGRLLRSPAEPYIKARGVASVRSPIRNVGGGGVALLLRFQQAVADEFRALYVGLRARDAQLVSVGRKEAVEVPELVRGYKELRSREWLYTQTPQFTLSTHPTADDPRPRPTLPAYLPSDFRAEMMVRHGQITAASGLHDEESSLVSTYLHTVADWRARVEDERVGRWLNELLGVRNAR